MKCKFNIGDTVKPLTKAEILACGEEVRGGALRALGSEAFVIAEIKQSTVTKGKYWLRNEEYAGKGRNGYCSSQVILVAPVTKKDRIKLEL